jgi:hypothetical protein
MDPKRERPPENGARDSGDGFDLRRTSKTRPALRCRACPARGAFRGHVEKTKRINELIEPEILFGKL